MNGIQLQKALMPNCKTASLRKEKALQENPAKPLFIDGTEAGDELMQ